MKLVIRVAVVLFIVSCSLQASAQADANYDERILYTSKYYKYKNMKVTGLVMTIGGGILGIVGINKLSHAPTTLNSQGQTVATGDQAASGAAMFLLSIPLVGAGVPLSIVGNVKSRKYRKLMESVGLGASVTPRGSGIGITYKF
jgi:hypothetical protein